MSQSGFVNDQNEITFIYVCMDAVLWPVNCHRSASALWGLDTRVSSSADELQLSSTIFTSGPRHTFHNNICKVRLFIKDFSPNNFTKGREICVHVLITKISNTYSFVYNWIRKLYNYQYLKKIVCPVTSLCYTLIFMLDTFHDTHYIFMKLRKYAFI